MMNPPADAADAASKPNRFPTADYQVAELTWKDGHLGMHAFGIGIGNGNGVPPNPNYVHSKSSTLASSVVPPDVERCCCLDKPLAPGGGTLESIVNQATNTKTAVHGAGGGEQLPLSMLQLQVNAGGMSCGGVGGSCSTLVGSCSVVTPAATLIEEADDDWSSLLGSDQQDTCQGTGGYTAAASLGSVCHSRNQLGGGGGGDDKDHQDKKRVRVLGKRSRCAAVHNQSERKRRDKINQRMSILQKLVPNSSKTDKASMLDQVIEYMKLLQNKVDIINRSMNISTNFMLPFPALQQQQQQQQQLHMSFMSSPTPMTSSMGMGLNVTRPIMPTPASHQGFYPFMPSSTMGPQSTSFLASQSQPSMTMDAYSRMAAMYHHLQVPPSAPPASHIKRI